MNLLKEFIQYLATSEKKVSKTTLKNYSADIRRFILWCEDEFGKAFNICVTVQVITIYRKTSSQEQKNPKYKKLSPPSLERHLSSLNRFFKFLKKQNIIPKNPFEEIRVSLKRANRQNQWFLTEFKNYLYLDRAASLTIKNYIVDINQFFSWLGGEKDPFGKINPMLISEYKYYLLTPAPLGGMGLSPTTINRKLSSLRKYFAWAKKQNLIDINLLQIGNEKVIPLKQAYFNNKEASREAQAIENQPKGSLQKTIQAIAFLFDNTIAIPLAKLIEQGRDLFWTLKVKPIFETTSFNKTQISQEEKSKIFSYLPLYKKLIYYLNHRRPKWYKKYHQYSIVHYLHFAILVILMSAIGTSIYNKFFSQSPDTGVLSATISTGSTRILSLKGRLTDSFDNPIASKDTRLRVAIYNDSSATGSALLWEETLSINPDKDGVFYALLGKNTPLPQNMFFLHPSLWLGVSVGKESELVPRQEVATSSYASNSQALQGLLPITDSASGAKNVVLALDSSGNLTIGKDSAPIFQAVGGQFTLSGKVLLLSTVTGSDANIFINPDGLGKIDLQKPLQNTSENNNISTAIGALEVNDLFAVLATSSGQSAFTINQDSIGPIISASTSGTAKFTVENSGNIVSSSGANWQPTFDGQNGLNIASASGVPFVTFDTKGLNVGIANPAPEKTLDVLGSFRISEDITFSNFDIEGGILYASTSGQISQIAKGESTQCLLGGSVPKFGSCVSYNNITEAGGSIGIGTTSPISKFHVTHPLSLGPTGKALVVFDQIENQDIFTASSSGITRFRLTNTGNIAINTTNTSNPITIGTDGANGNGAYLTIGGIWTNASGREMKENFLTLDPQDILDKINRLPVLKWNYKLEDSNIKHIGPIAEDFYALFGIGNDNKHISSIDPAGVALLGIQALSSKIASGIGDFTEIVVANLKVGFVKAEEITTNSLAVTKESVTIAGKNLKDYVTEIASNETIQQFNNRTIVSPIAEIDQILTNIISPLASNSLVIHLGGVNSSNSEVSDNDSRLLVENASGSAVATIDSFGNASFSGTLASTDLDVDKDATIGGTLRANKIVADSIEGLEARVSDDLISPIPSDFPSVPSFPNGNLTSSFGTFTNGLMSFGPTSLAETAIAGPLYIEGSLTLASNSINVLGADLKLQSLKQGGISFLSGLIYIDRDGNIKVEGDADFAKHVRVGGVLSANILSPIPDNDLVFRLQSLNHESGIMNQENDSSSLIIQNSTGSAVLSVNQSGDLVASGSATFSKLNLNLVQPAFAISPTEIIATSSAGLAAIKANQTELTIKNNIVTDKSLIYITPVGTPSAQTPFLVRQTHGEPAPSGHVGSFTVGLQSASTQDTFFNWLIVN